MEVKNCRGCGRLFNYVAGIYMLCPACMEELEGKFTVAKEFIRDNKNATIPMVAEAADVTTQQVERWVKEERLVFSDDSPIGIECESCGAMIKSGRFCDKCRNGMANSLGNMYADKTPKIQPKKDPRDNPRMRFLS